MPPEANELLADLVTPSISGRVEVAQSAEMGQEKLHRLGMFREAGLVERSDEGQARALGLAVHVTVSQIQEVVEVPLHHAEVIVHIDATLVINIGFPIDFALV